VKADKSIDEKVKEEFLTFYRLLEEKGLYNTIDFIFESQLASKPVNEY